MGGGATSCSNGSDDPTPDNNENVTPPTEDKEVIDLSKLNSWWEGGFEVEHTTASAIIKVTGQGKDYVQYAKLCGADISFNNKNKATLKVKNNDTKEAYVKIDIKSDSNGSAVTVATANGEDRDVQYGGADMTIPTNGEAVFILTLDTSKNADKFIVGLNNNGESAPSSGNITISDAYLWKE